MQNTVRERFGINYIAHFCYICYYCYSKFAIAILYNKSEKLRRDVIWFIDLI